MKSVSIRGGFLKKNNIVCSDWYSYSSGI